MPPSNLGHLLPGLQAAVDTVAPEDVLGQLLAAQLSTPAAARQPPHRVQPLEVVPLVVGLCKARDYRLHHDSRSFIDQHLITSITCSSLSTPYALSLLSRIFLERRT